MSCPYGTYWLTGICSESDFLLLSKLSEAEDAVKIGEEWKSLDDLKKALEV